MLLANWRPVRLVLLGFFCVPFYLSGTWRALMHVVGPLMPVIRDQIFCALCRPFAMLPVMSSVFWAYLEWGLHKICPNYGVLWSFWLRISFPAVLLWVFYLFVFGFFFWVGSCLFIYLFQLFEGTEQFHLNWINQNVNDHKPDSNLRQSKITWKSVTGVCCCHPLEQVLVCACFSEGDGVSREVPSLSGKGPAPCSLFLEHCIRKSSFLAGRIASPPTTVFPFTQEIQTCMVSRRLLFSVSGNAHTQMKDLGERLARILYKNKAYLFSKYTCTLEIAVAVICTLMVSV